MAENDSPPALLLSYITIYIYIQRGVHIMYSRNKNVTGQSFFELRLKYCVPRSMLLALFKKIVFLFLRAKENYAHINKRIAVVSYSKMQYQRAHDI